ncbi:cobalt/nickel transport system permease protein [Cellulosimicrobium aquatile]|uniref:Cobalt/nickel transport system permease protein n=1 Tax=Cellulosimicrobium aquatile TaxID=1612203 RepID=A0A1N6PQB1_9MICO|nr:energy-coupling factor ABC transporter permease [Cellulosimicrobium aquatile]NMF28184.1 cobalt ABC transporter permease [Cellulosimicrobium aquatile]SIQ06487.1 cobalt/nickel transport system permease protein [Cellulosimicrobium aquatile]
MHVPDHFLDDPTSATTAVVSLAAVGYAAYRAREDLTPRRVALTAATTGFVFAVQMLNYPVAAGTSGHLMGGALAAALVGPWLGVLSVTAVLLVQALVFADGGLTALGTNVLLMAVVGTLVGWAVTRGVLRATRGRGAAAAAGAGALVSVPVSAAVFAGLFAVGGTVPVPVGELVGQMLGVHLLVGLGEALITAGVVGLVLAVAPGVAAVEDRRAPALAPSAPLAAVRRAVLALGTGALLAAVVVSSFAAATPDGLEATAESVGFADAARDHAFAGAPLADYGEVGGIFVGVAGLVGVALVVALTVGVLGAGLRAAGRRTARAGVTGS